MKKTVFGEPEFSVAVSDETGCIVMVKTHGKDVMVIGSLTRDQTLHMMDTVQSWMPRALRPDHERPVDAEVMN